MAKRRFRPLYIFAALFWCGLVFVLLALYGFFGLEFAIYMPKSYRIPQSGMSPAILAGDYVFAWRNYYRERAPKRDDVVVYLLPKDPQFVYIQRVIGLPGDRKQVKEGILHINGAPIERSPLLFHHGQVPYSIPDEMTEYVETLPEGVSYIIWEVSDERLYDNTPEYIVPPGHYFFLGDNRDNSLDSREMNAVGLVPQEKLRDRPVFVFWSGNSNRIGTPVQPLP